MEISRRLFGKRGPAVTQVGLGGEGVLRTSGRGEQALAVIERAAGEGIAYFDTAPAYAQSQDYYGRFWERHPNLRSSIFQTSKSASRSYAGAKADLAGSLQKMGLESLDLWQIHDIRTRQDIEQVEGPGGALQAFMEAKDTGLTRYLGVTGHHDPRILLHAVQSWPVDAALMPVNPVEASIGGFMDAVMPAALDRGLAVIAMKVLGGSHHISAMDGITAELLLRFALSRQISTAVVGCKSSEEASLLAAAGREFQPLAEEEQEWLVEQFRPHARRLAYYRGVI